MVVSDSLSALIRDALCYARDPLTSKGPYFGEGDECAPCVAEPEIGSRTLPVKRVEPSLSPPLATKPLSPPPAPPTHHPQPSSPIELSQIQRRLQKIAPQFLLHDTALGMVDVLLFLCDSSSETLTFCQALAKAITERLGSVKILVAAKIEEEGRWPQIFAQYHCRLCLATDRAPTFSGLKRHLAQSVPFVQLSPVSVYKDAAQKGLLWKSLCQHLQ